MIRHSPDIRALVQGDQSVPHLVVAFARRRHLFSMITRSARINARWGHTALWDERRGVFNESMLFKGVTETHQDDWFDHYSAWDLVAVGCDDPEAGIDWARWHAKNQTPYDYAGAYSVPFRETWQSEHRLYCSEKETLALMKAGRTLFRDPERGIHPHDLWRVCVPVPWTPQASRVLAA